MFASGITVARKVKALMIGKSEASTQTWKLEV